MEHAFDLIVIGGGPAGITAALRARELGSHVALVEKAELGGTCTNDGCVPTRVLAKAARLWRDSEQFSAYALSGPRPTVDFRALLSRTQEIIYQIHEKKQLLGHLSDSGIEAFSPVGETGFVDPQTLKLEDGRLLSADKFIICAGGRANRPSFPGSEHALTHSDIWALRELPKRVAIVGAAATGCQLASVLHDFGSEVTLLEAAPRILATNEEAVSLEMTEAFVERGISVIAGTDFDCQIEQIESGFRYHYSVDRVAQSIEVDAVVLAIGWLGNADSLNLEAAGVASERSYIRVDEYLRTSAPHIYAAGDITGRAMLVQTGQHEGRIAADNALGNRPEAYHYHIVPSGGFTDPEYASVGVTEKEAEKREPVVSVTVPYSAIDRAVIDGHPRGLCKLIVAKESHRILGAHVVGEQALEVIHLVAAGMQADMGVEQLAKLAIAYPTYAAIVGIAARKLTLELGIEPIASQWLSVESLQISEWERRD
ncbi:MAG: NAD(P)/FAD-dependent oxidoreductase [Verrucomicrobiota bacterium]